MKWKAENFLFRIEKLVHFFFNWSNGEPNLSRRVNWIEIGQNDEAKYIFCALKLFVLSQTTLIVHVLPSFNVNTHFEAEAGKSQRAFFLCRTGMMVGDESGRKSDDEMAKWKKKPTSSLNLGWIQWRCFFTLFRFHSSFTFYSIFRSFFFIWAPVWVHVRKRPQTISSLINKIDKIHENVTCAHKIRNQNGKKAKENEKFHHHWLLLAWKIYSASLVEFSYAKIERFLSALLWMRIDFDFAYFFPSLRFARLAFPNRKYVLFTSFRSVFFFRFIFGKRHKNLHKLNWRKHFSSRNHKLKHK